MKRSLFTVLSLATLAAVPVHAGEWRVGPAISVVTGVDDVGDIYEENYNNTHTFTQVEVKYVLPIGIGVQGTYTWDSGVRLDMGLGPLFFMSDTGDGDVDTGLDHTEVPISATVGYTFIPSGTVSPYVRAGFAYHFASGDYVEGSTPGLLAAVGLEFMRESFASVSLELAVDKSTVEIERFSRGLGGVVTRRLEDVNTYETIIAVIIKF
jgi:hypothetical protein